MVAAALQRLLEHVDVAAVVTEESGAGSVARVAGRAGVKVASTLEIPALAAEELDLALSVLFWRRIVPPLISSPRLGCVNIHPAPLPAYRGFAPYTFAILDAVTEWGATAHVVDEDFDTGDMVATRRFPIDPNVETALSLQARTSRVMLELVDEIVRMLFADDVLPRLPQGPGHSHGREEFERLREIRPDDPPEVVDRKIRAYWAPPWSGAYVRLGEIEYTVLNDQLLRLLAQGTRLESLR